MRVWKHPPAVDLLFNQKIGPRVPFERQELGRRGLHYSTMARSSRYKFSAVS